MKNGMKAEKIINIYLDKIYKNDKYLKNRLRNLYFKELEHRRKLLQQIKKYNFLNFFHLSKKISKIRKKIEYKTEKELAIKVILYVDNILNENLKLINENLKLIKKNINN